MKAIFYGNHRGNFVDKAIRWWTSPFSSKFNGKWKDSFSHVEILFSDGMMFSASQYENSTRFAFHKDGPAWVEIELGYSRKTEDVVREFCNRHEGAKYDYLGILGFLFGNRDDSGKWFCSEVCTEALKSIGMFDGVDSADVSPNDLYNMLKEIGYDSK